MDIKLTDAKKTTVRNALRGWNELQQNPRNCMEEFNSIKSILEGLLNNTYNPDNTWERPTSTLFIKKFSDPFHANWSLCIDISRRNKTTVGIFGVNENDWREVICIGNYHSYEISTKCKC